MKLKLILISLAMAGAVSAMAEYITPEQALKRVSSVSETAAARKAAVAGSKKVIPAKTINDSRGVAAAYLFGAPGEGFILLSADSDVTPLLGYSDSGDFDPENIPCAMQWWIDGYAEEIDNMRKAAGTKIEGSVKLPDSWDAIKPLCKTKWSQGDPYNRMTPVHNGSHCATGCVATGMAQAMKYFNWPKKGSGEIKFNVSHIGDLYMNFGETEFDWDNMSNTYGSGNTEKQKDAVALLMKACGYATRMWYNTGSSGTQSSYIAGGLKGYLGYHQDTRFEERKNYTSLDWATMIYNNILNCGPVVYSGYSNIGEGHCFVCDGYDGKGLFHFNWGWGGQSDGYFLLNNLNPSEQGIGGSPGGFRYGQNAIIGMRPPTQEITATVQDPISQKANMHPEIIGTIFAITPEKNKSLRWVNGSDEKYEGSIGLTVSPVAGTAGNPFTIDYANIELEPGGSVRPKDLPDSRLGFDIKEKGLKDGSYKVAVVFRQKGSDLWTQVATSNSQQFSHCRLNIEGDKYTVVESSASNTQFEVSFSPEFYYDFSDKVKVTILNPGDAVATHGIAPCYLSAGNEIIARGEGLLLDIEPGETIEREWNYKFIFVNTPNKEKTIKYYAGIYDPTTYEILWKAKTTTEMKPAAIPNVKLGKFRVENATREDNVYKVADPSDIHFYTELYFNEGELPNDLHISIWDTASGENIGNFAVPEYSNVEVGAKALPGNTKVDLTGLVKSNRCKAYLSYYGFNLWNHLASRSTGKVLSLDLELDLSGVSEITAAGNGLAFDRAAGVLRASSENGIERISLYDITGAVKAEAGFGGAESAELSLKELPGGLYIAVMTDDSGHTTSVKIIK